MTDTLGFSLGPPPSDLAVGSFLVRSEWLEERRSSIELVAVLDEALDFAVLSVLRRIQEGVVRLQIESGGRAFPDGLNLGIGVTGGVVASLLARIPEGGTISDTPNGEGLVLGWIDLPGGRVRLMVSWTEVGEGSLWSRIGTALEHGALIAIASLVLAGPAGDVHRDMQWRGQIDRMLNGAPCRSISEFDPSLAGLRRQSADALRFDRLSPGHPDYAARVCTVQILLRWAGEHPGPIDGVPGSKTKAALREFASKHDLKEDDERVFDVLVDEIQPPRG